MSRSRGPVARLSRGAGAAALLGGACVAYAGLYEVNAYRLRRTEVAVLPPGARPLRVLHLSDLHLTPQSRARQTWVSRLAGLEPDLVIDTGDNLAHREAVPFVTRTLGRLLERPGVYVWGSNDYYEPTYRNPLRYLTRPSRAESPQQRELPWRDLGQAFQEAGWVDLNDRRATLEVNGLRVGFRGTDDAHLNQDHYDLVSGPVTPGEFDVTIGVTHAPYGRVLDAMTADGMDLVVAGHTHGGQVCVPGYGALVTNCDLDTRRVKGLSSHTSRGRTSALHVSAGLGTSPYAPIRFACPPEASLLTLVARDTDR